MPRNTSVTLGDHFDQFVANKIEEGLRRLEDDEAKLDALRSKLQASKESPLVNGFDPQQFLVEMRTKSGQ